jgi:hypothetical protein
LKKITTQTTGKALKVRTIASFKIARLLLKKYYFALWKQIDRKKMVKLSKRI